jgi:isopenicillin-N epimerase
MPDDEVGVLSHGYGAVRIAVRFVTERAGGRMVEAEIPFPHPDAAAIVGSIAGALTSRTRIAVIDHVTSGSALVLPLREIIIVCHAAGVPVLVDGAHGPGQVTLDLGSLGADWYVGNCHKWLCAPKGSAFLWAAPVHQTGLHPLTISHGFGHGFRAEFDWSGTRDVSAYLAIPTAIDFHHRLGGAALRARNMALAAAATRLLADRLGTDIGATGTLAGAMGVVRLPIAAPPTADWAQRLRQKLLDARTDAPVHALDGAIWLRISAHAYNELADYEVLAEIIAGLI